jgi:hypothetical protein
MIARSNALRRLPVTLVSLGALASFACGGDRSTSAPIRVDDGLGIRIINGAVSDATQESVVRLDQDGEFACTATLVAPNLVLTARHCVEDLGGHSECGTFRPGEPASSLSISAGLSATPTGIVGKQIFVEASNDGCTTDVALLLLASDVPNAKIAKVRFSTAVVGEPAVTVGYGDDGTGEPPAKREQRAGLSVDGIGPSLYEYTDKHGTKIPVDLSPGELVTGESTCSGDSGGPLFDATGQIVAVTSRGVDDECVDRPSIYATVAAHEQIIRDAFAASGHSVDDPLSTEPQSVDAGVPAASPPPPAAEPAAAPAPPSSVRPEPSDGCAIGARPRAMSAASPLVLALLSLGARRRRRARSSRR